MIDIITLIIAIGALCGTILNNIRTSKCFGVEIDTRTPPPKDPSRSNTPIFGENDPLIPKRSRANSPAIIITKHE